MEAIGETMVDPIEDTPEAEDIVLRAIDNLPTSLELGYVDYRDELSSEQVDDLLHGRWEQVEEHLYECWSESRYEAAVDAAEQAVDDEDEWEIVRADEDAFDELLSAIQERDTFDPLSELLARTGSVLFRYDLDYDVACDTWNLSDSETEDEVRAIAEAAGIDYDTNRANLLGMLGNVGNGGRLSVLFECSAETVVRPALDIAWGNRPETLGYRITWSNPTLLVLNRFEGSGFASDPVDGTVSVPFDPANVVVDSVSSYGWSEVAGPIGGAYSCEPVVS